MRCIAIAACGLVLGGCAARVPRANINVLVPRPCIKAVKLTDKTYCAGKDLQHMVCMQFEVDYYKNCSLLEVKK